MSKLNLQEIVELVQSNQIKEAAQIFNTFVDDLPPAERGQVYVDLMGAYLDINSANQEGLLELLDQQISRLKELNSEERSLIDEAEISRARNLLK